MRGAALAFLVDALAELWRQSDAQLAAGDSQASHQTYRRFCASFYPLPLATRRAVVAELRARGVWS